MADCLHITNGDCATALMQAAGLDGDRLPWRDLLHQGPVPKGLDLDDLSSCRANYIAEIGWGDTCSLQQGFKQRDHQLRSSDSYQQVMLWFEHDLYDQLQLLQLLDYFHQHPHSNLQLICTDQYLGHQSPEQLLQLRRFQQPVTDAQLKLAAKAWSAFRDPDPTHWQALRQSENPELPFLDSAVLRMLQEYPSRITGLSRSAEQALQLAAEGIKTTANLFSESQNLEQQMFMGDASFWQLLAQLIAVEALQTIDGEALLNPMKHPPKQAGAQRVQITSKGQALLNGEKTWWQLYPIDHWIGGVHLRPDNLWCWDPLAQNLVLADPT